MFSQRERDMEDIHEEDIDEDDILASLSPEELQELQKEMDVLAPDERVPLGQRQKDQKKEKPSADSDDEEDIDEDDILANLSPEELKELQKEMDVIAPDERVPVGQRQKSQTEKVPTGSFDHRGLVDYLYWEKESKRMLEEERVPVTLLPSKKTMEEDAEQKENAEDVEIVYEVIEEIIEVEATDCVEGEEVIEEIIEEMIVEEEEEDVKKEEEEEEKKDIAVKYERVIEKHEHPVNERLKESSDDNSTNTVNTTSPLQPPPEFADMKEEKEIERTEQKSTSQIPEKVKSNTTDAPAPEVIEMTPEEKRACFVPEKEVRVINKLNIPKLALGGGLGGLGGAKKTSRPSGNETNLDTTLDKIRNNNPAITDVNLNNIENIPKEMLIEYVDALKKNKHVKTFSIANTGADENIAFTLANMLRENRSITTLNIESNFITGKGIIAIIRCLQFNETLTELRFHNQRHMLGHHAEMEVSRLLKANNTLLKMGYHFEQAGPRMVVTNLLTRNLDRQRQQRKEEQSKQQQKQQKEVFEMYERALNLPPGLLAMLGYVPPEIAALMPQLPKGPQGPMEPKPEPSSRFQQNSPLQQPQKQQNTSPQYQHKQLKHMQRNPIPQQPPSTDSSGNLLKDIQLKRTPKKRDPFLDIDPREDRRAERPNVLLKKTSGKERDTGVDEMVELKATLKDVMKTLKPVPRRRQPAKVDVTPRDELLNEIKKSNVAYLKAVPLPKELESRETSLFNL
ncbi:leiomodin-3-like [Coregonus clupeaformis]|uniref:leiomodin-3-like n=1 Tax=Coregonus clupeaformis TaxID=59861 RepID=UPI001BDFACE0|nr:leiomodin-3-like [Coregonus clupeaformis]